MRFFIANNFVARYAMLMLAVCCAGNALAQAPIEKQAADASAPPVQQSTATPKPAFDPMRKTTLRPASTVSLPTLGSSAKKGNIAEDEKVTVSFDNADIKDVLRWAADLTDKNFIVNKAVDNIKVTVISGEEMSKKEAWQVFLSILQVNGIALVETEDSIKVFPEKDIKNNAIPVVDRESASDEDVVVQIIKVKNIPAQQLITLLKPLAGQTAHFAAYPETNVLIIADRSSNIKQINQIIARLDKAGNTDIEVIPLKFASAKDVMSVVSSMMPKPAANPAEGLSINVASDERSNSIMMTGDPTLRQQVRRLIAQLDMPVVGDGNTRVFPLNYADAKETAQILEKIAGSAQKGEKDQAAIKIDVSVQPNVMNNSVIITAPPSMMAMLKNIIDKVDVRRPQVLVEAVIVEVSDDLSNQFSLLTAFNDVYHGDGFRGVLAGRNPKLTGSPTDPLTSPTIGGLLLGYYSNGDLRGLLRALTTTANTNILSTPTIIALNNEEASILVGENVPFKTGDQQGVTTTGSTTPTTTNQANLFTSIERQDIGVTLKIKPRINNNDSITLEIEQKVEAISPDNQGASDIVTNKREIKTHVLVQDKQILVLGGLVRDEIQHAVHKVPLLGDIPYLGVLFRGTSQDLVKRNLMVFIHPTIIRDNPTGTHLTEERYNKQRNSEIDFNNKVDWYNLSSENKPKLPEFDTYNDTHNAMDASKTYNGETGPVVEPIVNPSDVPVDDQMIVPADVVQ